MKSAAIILMLFVSLAARMACADIRIDEHVHSRDILGSGFLLIEDPASMIVPPARFELTPLFAPAEGRVTSMFGGRRDPIDGRRAAHAGMDIAHNEGAPVCAAAAGRVGFAGLISGCGITAILDHGAGLTTRYCHMDSLGVRQGQSVAQGQRIGKIGATGRATGPHLHFEVRQDGIPIDPAEHLYY